MPSVPPDLQKAPPQWKRAFKALKDYAIATGLSKVLVTVKRDDGSVVPAQVDLEPSADGIVIRITLP